MEENGFNKKDLAEAHNLYNFILETVAKEYPIAVAKSAGKHLNVQSGNLSNINNWKAKISGSDLIIESNDKIPYANIQDSGGKIKITDKMRAKMWALYKQTKKDIYKAIASTKQKYLVIKPTHFVEKVEYDIEKSTALKNYIKNI